MGNLEISKGKKFDITNISDTEISIIEIAKNKKKLIDIFKKFDLDNNNKLNTIELARAMDYFSSFDTDTQGEGLGNISEEEMKNGLLRLNKELQLDGEKAINEDDIKSFIKNTNNASSNREKINLQEFTNFGYDSELFDIQNVVDSKVIETGNEKKYVLTYKDGKIVTINNDKSYEVKTINNDKTINTEYYGNDNQKYKSIHYYPKNGDETTTTYKFLDGIGTVPEKSTCVYGNKTISETNYTFGVPTQEIVTQGKTVKIYNYIGSEIIPALIRENVNTPEEKTTKYELNENNSYTITTTELGKTTIKIARGYLPNSSTICETTFEETKEGNIKTEKIYLTDGYIEKITLNKEHSIITLYNSDNKKLSRTVNEGENTYYAEYDGKGNTKGVYVEFNETPQEIADQANCTVEDLLELNRSKLIKTGKSYGFKVGEEIMVPLELDPKNYLLYRDPESEKVKYTAWHTEQKSLKAYAKFESEQRAGSLPRNMVIKNFKEYSEIAKYLYKQEGVDNPSKYQIETRVQELKKLNPNLQDGTLMNKTIKIKYSPTKELEVSNKLVKQYRENLAIKNKKETEQGKLIAENLYEYMDNNMAAVGDEEFDKYFNQITPENIIGVIEYYDKKSKSETLLEAMWDEKGNLSSNRRKYQLKIVNMLIQRAQKAGLNDETIKRFQKNITEQINNQNDSTSNLHDPAGKAIDHEVKMLCKQIRLAESISPEERLKTQSESISPVNSTLTAMDSQSIQAKHIMEQQEDIDGWCADTWHVLKYVVTAGQGDTLKGNVEKEIKKYDSIKTELEKAYKTGGIKAFKRKLSEYGINYDKKLTSSYSAKLRNYNQVKAISNLYNEITESLPEGTSICSYTNLVKAYTKFLIKTNPNMTQKEAEQQLEQLIKNEMDAKGIKYTKEYSDNKYTTLRNMTDKVLNTMINEMKLYSYGQPIEKLEEELVEYGSTLFGTDKDVINRANNYSYSQTAGDIYVATGAKILALVAVGACTGGWAASAIGTFTSSMTIDVTNDLSRNTEYKLDRFIDTTKNALIDGVFAGAATFARDTIKGYNAFKSANKVTQIGISTTSDTTIGAIKQASTGGLSGENILYYLAFSALAHSTSRIAPTIKGLTTSNSQRVIRRCVNGLNKERNASNQEMDELEILNNNINVNDENVHENLLIAINDMNNSGELNALKRNLLAMKNEIPEKNRNEILVAINDRQEKLFKNPDLAVINSTKLSEETKKQAIAALASTNKHLLPEEIYAISSYIDSVTDTNELLNIYNKLKSVDINLIAIDSEIFCALDDRFSELNIKKPYKEMV